jgi:Prealbumin-like fold domain
MSREARFGPLSRLLSAGGKRRRLWGGVGVGVLAVGALMLGLALPAFATGPVGTAAGFEDDDGNLVVNSTFDWNGFSPVTWTGTAPFQSSSKTVNGWQFTGLTDAQKSNTDTGFAGGTKQDKDCPSVTGSSAPNKDDLKRIYVAHKTVNNHIFLELAWVRIPQNTTSPSAHVAFEFNQGTAACGAGSDGLVKRTAGDMLIVYDFEGGGTNTPTLTIRRWVTSGTCEISSDSPPCWGPAQNLTASGFAEAKVNTTSSVLDTVAPTNETLGLNEFGEAGIDLTAAGVFSSNVCTAFGQVDGVSRSSGNSGTAAMEDLVGPGPIRISNCGTLIVKKVTDPSPDPTNTSFSFTVDGPATQPAGTTLPKTFSLLNGQSNPTTVFAGNTYSAAETVPANWTLTSASCDNGSGTLSGSTISSISVAADEVVTCTFNDKLLLGALKIIKVSSKPAATPLAGAVFSITGPNSFSSTQTTGSDGTACVDHLPFGTYSVQETAAPPGYAIDDSTARSVPVGTNSTCGDGHEATFSATDTPLTDLTITVQSQVAGGTLSTITCTADATSTGIGNSPQGPSGTVNVTANGLRPGDYTCRVHVDP